MHPLGPEDALTLLTDAWTSPWNGQPIVIAKLATSRH
jgi:hypothetical protein